MHEAWEINRRSSRSVYGHRAMVSLERWDHHTETSYVSIGAYHLGDRHPYVSLRIMWPWGGEQWVIALGGYGKKKGGGLVGHFKLAIDKSAPWCWKLLYIDVFLALIYWWGWVLQTVLGPFTFRLPTLNGNTICSKVCFQVNPTSLMHMLPFWGAVAFTHSPESIEWAITF